MSSSQKPVIGSSSSSSQGIVELRTESDRIVRPTKFYVLATPLEEAKVQNWLPNSSHHVVQLMHWKLLALFDPVDQPQEDEDGEFKEAAFYVNRGAELFVREMKPTEEFKERQDRMIGYWPESLHRTVAEVLANFFGNDSGSSLESHLFNSGMVGVSYGDVDDLLAEASSAVKVMNLHNPIILETSPAMVFSTGKRHPMVKTQYNAVTNNCQHCVLDMLRLLGATDADFVGKFVPLNEAGGLLELMMDVTMEGVRGYIATKTAKKTEDKTTKVSKLGGEDKDSALARVAAGRV